MRHCPVAVVTVFIAGCMSMDGPCQVSLQVANGQARRSVQCEVGGSITLLAPANSIEAAGQVARPCACAPSSKP